MAAAFRVRATPTFFVNQQQVRGALPLATFRELLTQTTQVPNGR